MKLMRINERITAIISSPPSSNIYLVRDVLIDSGTGFFFNKLCEMLKSIGKKPEDIKNIINTHAHFDHVGGNVYFKNARIFIHEKDASVLENGDSELSCAFMFGGKLKPMKVYRKLGDGDEVFGLRVVHTPGHTPGSLCLLDESKGVLFSGDTLFSDGVGRTDLKGGDEGKLLASLKKLKEADFDVLLPGHGEPVLKNAKNVLERVIRSVYY